MARLRSDADADPGPGDARRAEPHAGAGPARAPAPGGAPRLVLASRSPRRRALLTAAGLCFEAVPADVPEDARPGESPRALVERLAEEKAAAVARRLGPRPPRLVLGSDTVVVLGDQILGKPRDAEDAVAMLFRLMGRTHVVWTGVALVESGTGATRRLAVASRVSMREAAEAELRSYVATGEPLDKAGAYAFQGEGRRFVARVEGSESNVIGLPMEETLALLRGVGVEPATR